MKKRSECSCSCHTNPHMKHIVACCEGDDLWTRLQQAPRIEPVEEFTLDLLSDAIKDFESTKVELREEGPKNIHIKIYDGFETFYESPEEGLTIEGQTPKEIAQELVDKINKLGIPVKAKLVDNGK